MRRCNPVKCDRSEKMMTATKLTPISKLFTSPLENQTTKLSDAMMHAESIVGCKRSNQRRWAVMGDRLFMVVRLTAVYGYTVKPNRAKFWPSPANWVRQRLACVCVKPVQPKVQPSCLVSQCSAADTINTSRSNFSDGIDFDVS